MIRTQIQLDEEQGAALKRLAVERGVSIAALVREGVDLLLAGAGGDADWEAALRVVGRHRGPGGSVAEDHDRHLEEAFTG